MKDRRYFICLTVWAVVAVLFATACGKKGDPIPPRIKLPVPVSDLSAATSAKGVVLRWSIPKSTVGIKNCRVMRSEQNIADACPGCPQEYRILVQLDMKDSRLEKNGGAVQYVDTNVKAGHYYSYRVVFCTDEGLCGGPSNVVGLKTELHTGQ